ncbi:cytochrome c oxidase subunit II [Sphingomonas sp. MAH-20]|uniref:Cytochrome c oxidase subunit 2 n=1 Tax=Sphingomonas horti TaxID=2682842 RepID=A0A6I4J0A7_9SPHN|nr:MULTISPECIES: cytochrome c oxidase subunit II [Sphingomonas]MBA2920791.1 cytochrome c oxidase subunit II [Sphingomonas sp. CGMCC 1.13658]MVO77726.1 cytochrome c oxidase subunit II [Sphingomonas horti]
MKLAKTLLLAVGLALAPAAAHAQDAPKQDTTTQAAAPAADSATQAPAAPAAEAAALPETAPVLGVGMPTNKHIVLQDQYTPNGRKAEWMHDYVLVPMMVGISVLVMLLLMYVIVRFRRAANPVPSRTSHNTVIEVIWTLVPVLILIAIAVPSISLLAAQFKPAGKDALTVKATGNQWYWVYSYPDNGGFEVISNMLQDKPEPGKRTRQAADGPRLLAVDNRMVIPVGRQIRLLTTSNDVIHSFAVPAFWAKIDAVPGRINEISFTVEKEGVYYGQCSELCGARHGFMPIAVEAVSPEKFVAWIKSKGGTMPGTPSQPLATPAPEKPVDATTGTDQPTPGTATPPVTSQGGQPNGNN